MPVRYDPFDIGTAYAFVDRQWVECHSEYYPVLHGHSEREVHLATEELRRRRQNHSGQFAVTAKKLAEFLESVETREEILLQRMSDLEARSLNPQPQLSSKPEAVAEEESPAEANAKLAAPSIPLAVPAEFIPYGEM